MRGIVPLCILGAVLLVPFGAYGEGIRERRPNFVGGELGGRAGIGSIHYERYLNNRFGVGIGGLWLGEAGGVMPLYLSTVPVGNTHSLYLSAGATFGWDSKGGSAWPALSVGYQFQSDGGFFLRLSVETFGLWPLLGISFGGSF
jgi:hypothetical protein